MSPSWLSLLTIPCVDGHGYIMTPRSRNYVAKLEGTEDRSENSAGIPPAEYCAHCLNRNNGVCGVSEGGLDYDVWNDARSPPHRMPWESQSTYTQGDVITVTSDIWVHHGGHLEIKGCALGGDSTQECMDEHSLMFVRDVTHGMPEDPNYPDRGYFHGGAGWNQERIFKMEFQLPVDLVGDTVLLQWRYITANSCSPPGYEDYFTTNSHLPSNFWQSQLPVCPFPYKISGEVMNGGPEVSSNGCGLAAVLLRWCCCAIGAVY